MNATVAARLFKIAAMLGYWNQWRPPMGANTHNNTETFWRFRKAARKAARRTPKSSTIVGWEQLFRIDVQQARRQV